VTDLAEQYIARHAKPHKRSWRADERLLHKEVLPHWGRRKAYDIKRADVIALLDGIVERGAPVQANRVLALVRKMFNWAISRDQLEHNPCVQVKAPGREQQRDRVLTDEEIRLVWDACVHLTLVMGAYFKMLLFTAQRVSEMRLMHWDDVDLETGWWTIPADVAKNGLAHRVPLSAPAQDVLRALQETTGSISWVFPSPWRRGTHFINIRKSAIRLRTFSEVDFVPHDLRRTVASRLTSLGFPRLTVSKVLNHAEVGVTRVYDRHSYDAEKREALEAWGRKVMELVNRNP
jgi:integrase